MLEKRNPPPVATGKAGKYTTRPTHDNSRTAQQQRLLAQLRLGTVSTLQARQDLDVMHPAARVQELREQGFRIVTNWRIDHTSEGKPHRVAEYVLLPGGGS